MENINIASYIWDIPLYYPMLYLSTLSILIQYDNNSNCHIDLFETCMQYFLKLQKFKFCWGYIPSSAQRVEIDKLNNYPCRVKRIKLPVYSSSNKACSSSHSFLLQYSNKIIMMRFARKINVSFVSFCQSDSVIGTFMLTFCR